MRGKLLRSFFQCFQIRITPADAGKTRLNWEAAQNIWDHPRRCGENKQGSENSVKQAGSPPQMRGKRFITFGFAEMPGITPADAGKTPALRLPVGSSPDHPRRCGENELETSRKRYDSGSPPQMRGKPWCFTGNILCERITPADAGKTRRSKAF